jgi:hypothetical protein
MREPSYLDLLHTSYMSAITAENMALYYISFIVLSLLHITTGARVDNTHKLSESRFISLSYGVLSTLHSAPSFAPPKFLNHRLRTCSVSWLSKPQPATNSHDVFMYLQLIMSEVSIITTSTSSFVKLAGDWVGYA